MKLIEGGIPALFSGSSSPDTPTGNRGRLRRSQFHARALPPVSQRGHGGFPSCATAKERGRRKLASETLAHSAQRAIASSLRRENATPTPVPSTGRSVASSRETRPRHRPREPPHSSLAPQRGGIGAPSGELGAPTQWSQCRAGVSPVEATGVGLGAGGRPPHGGGSPPSFPGLTVSPHT